MRCTSSHSCVCMRAVHVNIFFNETGFYSPAYKRKSFGQPIMLVITDDPLVVWSLLPWIWLISYICCMNCVYKIYSLLSVLISCYWIHFFEPFDRCEAQLIRLIAKVQIDQSLVGIRLMPNTLTGTCTNHTGKIKENQSGYERCVCTLTYVCFHLNVRSKFVNVINQ